jgi:hypothetical protein
VEKRRCAPMKLRGSLVAPLTLSLLSSEQASELTARKPLRMPLSLRHRSRCSQLAQTRLGLPEVVIKTDSNRLQCEGTAHL